MCIRDRPGPEKRCRHRGAPPFSARGSGSSLTGIGSGGRLGSSSSHFFLRLPPPLPFWPGSNFRRRSS
eukprot:14382181-Alexandrium_andersonii.AAC.1